MRRRASRGLTLIEMFIVLVAFAIIMSGAVVPLQRKQEADRVAETRARMDDIHAAIVGYAMRHRTPGLRYVIETREYEIPDTFITPDPDDPLLHLPELLDLGADPVEERAEVRSYWIPANRPYLPCPDYNNDGMEDRHDPSMTIVQQIMSGHVTDRKPVLEQSSTRTKSGIAGELRLEPDEDQPVRRLADEGTCAHPAGREDDGTTDRGALPWRTLGVLPHDPWGGRYTYRADAVFASALTGIGRRTAIDGYDPRVPLYHFDGGPTSPTLRLMPLRRGPVAANPDLRDALTPEPLVPSVVCGPTHANAPAGGNEFACDPFMRLPDIRIVDPVTGARSASNAELVAGSVATEPVPLDASNMRPIPFPVDQVATGATEPDAAVHRRGGITDGLPYVLVSHGPNQRLALNHNRLAPEGDINPCTVTPLGIGTGTRADGALVSPDEIHNSPCPVRPPASPSFGLSWMRPSQFVDRPRTTRHVWISRTPEPGRVRGLDADFDDIVEWGTRGELLESFAAAGALSPTDLPLLITR